jgi:hypothetical protein
METTEHIVETYVRYVKNWFTIPNVKARNGNELDILAIDTNENKKYHIEVSVHITSSFSKLITDEFEKGECDEAKRRRTMKFFIEDKFDKSTVLEKLNELGFKKGEYNRIIVTMHSEKSEKMEKLLKKHNIQIWEMKDIIDEMNEKLDSKYYSDDILRTLQLIKLVNK